MTLQEGTLAELLDDGAAYAAEYDDGLGNHRPMALLALHRLGATDQRLKAYAATYSTRLEPAPAPQAWPSGDAWKGRFSQREAWPAYRALFAQWIAIESAPVMLAQVLPGLMPGCGAAAFHGLIRTAYAMAAAHEQELADGLAYWACRFMPLGTMGTGAEDDPVSLLRLLKAGTSGARLIDQRMRDAASSGRVNQMVSRLALGAARPEVLARAAALAYAGSGSFTALHLVTATHAMRVITPYLDEPGTAWHWFWQAFATAVVAAALKPRPAAPLLAWDQIIEAAIMSDDDHQAKLVYSCREEETVYGGQDWQRAASCAVAAMV